ncbi:MAG: hypothetical protein ACUVRO_06160 [Armatimonadota bacterium]
MKKLGRLAGLVSAVLVLATASVAQSVTNHFVAKGTAVAFPVDEGTKQAQRFTSPDDFNKLEVRVAEASPGSAFTLTLYRWRGNYADTTGAVKQVVKSQTFEVSSPGWVTMAVPIQPAGVYLWEATAVPDRPGVSISGYEASTYLGGEAYTNGSAAKELEVYEQGNHVPENLGDGDSAQHFTATKPFNEIRVLSPTWNDETGQKGYTLKLFQWKGSYDETVASTPIASALVTNFKDNAWVSLFFPTQPEGEYMWLATDPIKPPVGHWRAVDDIYPDGEGYRRGNDTGGDFKFVIGYPNSGTDEHPDLESRTTQAVPMPKVSLIGPINDEAVAANPPTFKWEAVPDAESYTIEMSQTFNFDPAATITGTSSSPSYTPAEPMRLGRWYWRIKATTPAGETDYSQSTYQQTLVPPAEGGDVVLEDFEDISDWVMRALTFAISEEEKHRGKASMQVNYNAFHCFAAADAPIGRLIPKNADGANPDAISIWAMAPEEVEGPIQLHINVTTPEGQTSEANIDMTFDPADVGKWVKLSFDLADYQHGGLPLNDPGRTLSVFSLSRPDGLPAAVVYFDDLTVTYPKSSKPPVLKGDVNGDGKLGIPDATIALRIAVGLQQAAADQLAAGDLNGNGRIEIAEVTQILRAAVGLAKL